MGSNNLEMAKIVKAYVASYPDELKSLSLLFDQLNMGENLNDRNNFKGHATASAMVLNSLGDSILLVENRKLGMWLLPGGHLEDNESPLEGALREVNEETGLSFLAVASQEPLDINTHSIPENLKKGEPHHVHHDFRYVLTNQGDDKIVAQEEEIVNTKWVNIKSLGSVQLPLSLETMVSKFRESR